MPRLGCTFRFLSLVNMFCIDKRSPWHRRSVQILFTGSQAGGVFLSGKGGMPVHSHVFSTETRKVCQEIVKKTPLFHSWPSGTPTLHSRLTAAFWTRADEHPVPWHLDGLVSHLIMGEEHGTCGTCGTPFLRCQFILAAQTAVPRWTQWLSGR
jgi:hypothetical protein